MPRVKGRIYRPERILYYIKPSSAQLDDFYKGILPDELMKYDGAFGTYDCPGLFWINQNNSKIEVLGIEFRPNDEKITYPKNMESIILSGNYMVTTMLEDTTDFDDATINAVVNELAITANAHRFKNVQVKLSDSPDIVEIFTAHNHCRIHIQGESEESGTLDYDLLANDFEKDLYDRAYKDNVTGHYNWNYIWPIIAKFGSKGIQDFSFVHFDIKDFKAINIVYGHLIGNKVMTRVLDHAKEKDWIYFSAKCDNDNFALMIKDMTQEETKEKLLEYFDEISTLDEDPTYHIYYRCGVVPMRNTLLLGDVVADAGKQVQRLGKKLYETEVLFYSDSMHDEQEWSPPIRTYLETAIKRDEFLVYLQPKYDINTEKLCGAEALIRWKFQGKDLLAPYKFIPIFETGGQISILDDIVLKKVCSHLKDWGNRGLPLFPISVNLSRKSMGNPALVEHLTRIVDSFGIRHELIDFELTESAAYDNQNYMISVIKGLKANGFKISMDDFGTGYSSLSLLALMPFDTIKIDKSFVDQIAQNDENHKEQAVVKHIIAMSKDLNFKCLAEGAEEKVQVDILREFGCEVVQGYYYSKPLPVEEYEKKLCE